MVKQQSTFEVRLTELSTKLDWIADKLFDDQPGAQLLLKDLSDEASNLSEHAARRVERSTEVHHG